MTSWLKKGPDLSAITLEFDLLSEGEQMVAAKMSAMLRNLAERIRGILRGKNQKADVSTHDADGIGMCCTIFIVSADGEHTLMDRPPWQQKQAG